MLWQAPILGALVLLIGDAIAVKVPRRGTAVMPGQAWFIGAGIFGIGHPISIGVRTTFCQRRAGFIGAVVGPIEEAITISIFLAGRRTPIGLGQAGLIGTGILHVRDAVSIPIEAAVGELRPRLIRAQILFIGHPVAIPVPHFHGLHIHRGLALGAVSVDSPDDQGVCPSRERLPVGQQGEGGRTPRQAASLGLLQLPVYPQLDADHLALVTSDGVDGHLLPHFHLFPVAGRADQHYRPRLWPWP